MAVDGKIDLDSLTGGLFYCRGEVQAEDVLPLGAIAHNRLSESVDFQGIRQVIFFSERIPINFPTRRQIEPNEYDASGFARFDCIVDFMSDKRPSFVEDAVLPFERAA